jgi:hypothetical protein
MFRAVGFACTKLAMHLPGPSRRGLVFGKTPYPQSVPGDQQTIATSLLSAAGTASVGLGWHIYKITFIAALARTQKPKNLSKQPRVRHLLRMAVLD